MRSSFNFSHPLHGVEDDAHGALAVSGLVSWVDSWSFSPCPDNC